ncbi:MAG: gamma-glutamylcyclotransferase [Actinobacteria bacterium]|nr:gamma-glutamylcyclotransferase [Actinomycetota bacterium]
MYGTLRPGQSNWHHLARFAARSEPALLPGHRLYALEYPCAVGVASSGANDELTDTAAVTGDLVWLHPATHAEAVAHLDWFEDYRADDLDGSLYLREPAPVLTASGEQVVCWVYVAGAPQRARLRPEHEIAGGEWRSQTL